MRLHKFKGQAKRGLIFFKGYLIFIYNISFRQLFRSQKLSLKIIISKNNPAPPPPVIEWWSNKGKIGNGLVISAGPSVS